MKVFICGVTGKVLFAQNIWLVDTDDLHTDKEAREIETSARTGEVVDTDICEYGWHVMTLLDTAGGNVSGNNSRGGIGNDNSCVSNYAEE